MVRQGFGQAAIDGKGTTPFTIFFTIGHKCRVGVETINDRLEQSITNADAAGIFETLAVFIKCRTASRSQTLHTRVFLNRGN